MDVLLSRSSFLVLYLALFLPRETNAQSPSSYYPYRSTDTLAQYTLATQQRTLMRDFFEEPTDASREYRKAYAAWADEASQGLYRTLRYRALNDTLIAPYVQGVFDRLLAANPSLPTTRLVIVRSPIANAYATGSGIVVCNVGLLAALANENQLAFVLGHELAHVYFKHMQQGLDAHRNTFYSRAFEKKVDKIQKDEYNVRSKLSSLVRQSSLSKLYHNRSYEQQADSLGFRLMTAARFPGRQAHTALQLLEHIDAPSSRAANVPTYFGCEDTYPLWVRAAQQSSSSIFAVATETPTAFELSDTLKTHPNCQARARSIQQLLGESPDHPDGERASHAFRNVRAASQLETIQSWFDYQRYDQVLFEALQQPEASHSSDYLSAIHLLSLHQLKKHMEQHSYADVVASASDLQPESLRHFLKTLESLNLPDFARLAQCAGLPESFSSVDNEYQLAATYAWADLTGQTDEAARLKTRYLTRYPTGSLKIYLFGDSK